MAAAANSVNEHLRITVPLKPVSDTSTIFLHPERSALVPNVFKLRRPANRQVAAA
jgi:hypothetical protein